MLIACWSVKGGSGTTVVATSLALLTAARSPSGVVLADMGGDIPLVLGRPQHAGPGLAEWSSTADVGIDALSRLVDRSEPRVAILRRGDGPIDGDRLSEGLAALSQPDLPVVIDCGTVNGPGPAATIAAVATISLLVIRPCYLALKRANRAPLKPSALVLVDERHRVLSPGDVAAHVGAPIKAVVRVDPAVARAVDAGLLAVRLPRALANGLRDAA